MTGTNANTGKSITGIEHLKQCVADILSTPIGSRVIRRDYGSELFNLIDKPLNNETKLDIVAASAEAIARWEPRFSLKKINVERTDTSKLNLVLHGQYKQNTATIAVSI